MIFARGLFINFFDDRTKYPTFKSKFDRQSLQDPAHVKILSQASIKFPGYLGTVKAKVHRDLNGKLKTVTVSRMPDGRYYASLLVDDGTAKPESSSEGKAIGLVWG